MHQAAPRPVGRRAQGRHWPLVRRAPAQGSPRGGPREGDALCLSARDEGAVFAHSGLESTSLVEPRPKPDAAEHRFEFTVFGVWLREEQILSDALVEDMGPLLDESDGCAHLCRRKVLRLDTVEPVGPFVVEEPHEHVRERRLTRARFSFDKQSVAGCQLEEMPRIAGSTAPGQEAETLSRVSVTGRLTSARCAGKGWASGRLLGASPGATSATRAALARTWRHAATAWGTWAKISNSAIGTSAMSVSMGASRLPSTVGLMPTASAPAVASPEKSITSPATAPLPWPWRRVRRAASHRRHRPRPASRRALRRLRASRSWRRSRRCGR